MITKLERSQQTAVVIAIVVVICGPIILFDSATTYSSNNQMSSATVNGWEWHLDNKEKSHPSIANTGRDVYAYYYFGYEDTREFQQKGAKIMSETEPPKHLGYRTGDTIAEAIEYEEDVYVITNTADRQWWQNEPAWRHDDLSYHTVEDHERLQNDRVANRLYHNGETDVWLIKTRSSNS